MYAPSAVPEDAPRGLKAWLADQLRSIANELNRPLHAPPRGAEPQRPHNGDIAYADGVHWDPAGDGTAGFFGRENGAWVKL